MKYVKSMMLVIALLCLNWTANAQQADIVDTAAKAGSFETLAAALKAADLIDALKGDGPFTVFAPTDEAFNKLPSGTVKTLLMPENKDQLTAVLTYHVVPGNVMAKQVVELRGAKSLNGQRIDISVQGNQVMIDKAKVVKTDIKCKNGVIHVIDSVILPSGDNIVATADKAGKFKTLLAAAKAAGLVEALNGKGPFTVFAPTDAAFEKLPKGTVESLLKPENKNKLADILKYHVVPGRVYSEDALNAEKAKTLQGSEITISASDGKAKINDAVLLKTDIDASNGVIHVIDSVIMPIKKIGAVEGRQIIERAVARGSSLFNAGHHQRCAQLYSSTLTEMMASMPSRVQSQIRNTLSEAALQHCPTERSWTLRHGLDRAYASLIGHH